MLGPRYRYDSRPVVKLNPVQQEAKLQIEEKLKSGYYKLEEFNCFMCTQRVFDKLSEKDRFGLPVSIVICKRCGLIQTNPRMNDGAYKEFYEKEHTPLTFGERKASKDMFLDQYFHARKIHKYIRRYLPKSYDNFFVLEIGCGAGGILAYFNDLGCRVLGCDLDGDCIEFGRSFYGLEIFKGVFADLKFKGRPKLVIMSHILEHLLNPEVELSLIRNVIDSSGFLYIEVPGIRNLTHTYYDMDFLNFIRIAHTYHFSLTTLNNLLGKAGFELIQGDERIRSLFRLSKDKQFKIVNDYQRQITYLKRIEFLRRVLPLTPFKIRYSVETLFEKIFKILKVYNLMRFFYRKLIKHPLPKKYD